MISIFSINLFNISGVSSSILAFGFSKEAIFSSVEGACNISNDDLKAISSLDNIVASSVYLEI